jgi:hypothetical protein
VNLETTRQGVDVAVSPWRRLVLLAWRELGRNEWLVTIRDALSASRPLPDPPTNVPGPFGLVDPLSADAEEAASYDAVAVEQRGMAP